MSYYIEINGVPNSPQRVRLEGSSATVGSSPSCQVPIAHAEVSDQALLIDVRGDDFWVQNLNAFSIYVGMDEVTPNGWSPCELGVPIQLTKNVSLTVAEEVQPDSTAAADSEKKASALDASKLIQIVLIVACFIGAVVILFADNEQVAGEIDNEFDFNQVVAELEINNDDIEYVAVRKYLQQAWMADRRFRMTRPDIVLYFYELLINHRLVRENPNSDQTLTEIAEYATRRLSNLRFNE